MPKENTTEFLRPQAMHPGDALAVVAPSGAFDHERFLAGIRCVERAGLVPHHDDGLFARQRYLAGSDSRRLEEFRRALASDTKGIWTARGGYGAGRLLPGLDVQSVRAAKKWLVGFSDVTALHCLWARAGIMSIHGPNITTIEDWGAMARRDLWDMLFEGHSHTLEGRQLLGAGAVSGPLLGGNLTVLASLAGTGFLPSFAGAILVLEDIGEAPYRLDRSLSQLLMSGALDGVVGVALGQWTGCESRGAKGKNPGYDAQEILLELLEPLGIPVVGALPIGHDPSSHAVILGATTILDADAGMLRQELPGS